MEATLNLKSPESPEGKIIQVKMNEPQMMVRLIGANETYLLWGRGTGKSTGALAPHMANLVDAMPGHLGCILGMDYTHLDTNVLPKLYLGLQSCGYKEGEHFVLGKPPKSWPSCLFPIKNWERTMTWRNGTSFQQISVHKRGSANAFDFQSLIVDEAKFFAEEDIEGEVTPAMRGFDKIFGHKPEYLSKIFATDKYADYIKIKWLLDKRKKVDQKKIDTVYQLQLHLMELDGALVSATKQEAKKINDGIRAIRVRLDYLRKDLVYVSEASAEDNKGNLGKKWWAEQNKKPEYEKNVAVKNEDPTRSENGFYPGLTEKHTYVEIYPNFDCVPTLPFIVAMDYQHSIAPMDVTQLSRLPNSPDITLNYIQEFYAMAPKGLEDTVDQMCDYYKHHGNKQVYYVYDNTAIALRVSAKPVKDIVVDRFHYHRWVVHEVYTGQGLDHYLRYERLKNRMTEKDVKNEYYPFRFNKSRLYKTLISMRGAGAVQTTAGTKKNKEYENTKKYPRLDQSETTHFSEVFDQIDYAVNELRRIHPGGSPDGVGAGFR